MRSWKLWLSLLAVLAGCWDKKSGLSVPVQPGPDAPAQGASLTADAPVVSVDFGGGTVGANATGGSRSGGAGAGGGWGAGGSSTTTMVDSGGRGGVVEDAGSGGVNGSILPGGDGRDANVGGSSSPYDAAILPALDVGAGGQGGTVGACGAGRGGTTGGGGPVRSFAPVPGYGWVNLGIRDTASSPSCGGAPIAGQPPATFAMAPSSSCPASSLCWEVFNGNFPNALCFSGSIPAVPASSVDQDYAEDWGVLLGFTFTTPLPAQYRSITFSANNSYSPTDQLLRTAIHLRGDPDTVVYCADINPYGAMVPFTNFHTPCRNTPGAVDKSLPDINGPNIDKVGLLIEAGASGFTVTDLCLWYVSFNSDLTGTGGANGMLATVGLPGAGGADGGSTP